MIASTGRVVSIFGFRQLVLLDVSFRHYTHHSARVSKVIKATPAASND